VEDKREDKCNYRKTFTFLRVTLSALKIRLLSIQTLLKININKKIIPLGSSLSTLVSKIDTDLST